MITIRPARETDVPRIGELFDLYRQFYEREPDLPAATSFIRERLSRQESEILVAETGDLHLIGFCQLYPLFCSLEAKPIYSLSDLFVLPDHRRLRAGRDLLLAAERLAKANGKARMDLTTAKTNITAQTLYESLGWVRDEVYFAYTRAIEPVE